MNSLQTCGSQDKSSIVVKQNTELKNVKPYNLTTRTTRISLKQVKIRGQAREFCHVTLIRFGVSHTKDHGYAPFLVITIRSYPYSWFITGLVTRVTWQNSRACPRIFTCFSEIRFNLTTCNPWFGSFLVSSNRLIKEIMIGTTSSGISDRPRDIYSICRWCWNVATSYV
jgi:hypothetical protein